MAKKVKTTERRVRKIMEPVVIRTAESLLHEAEGQKDLTDLVSGLAEKEILNLLVYGREQNAVQKHAETEYKGVRTLVLAHAQLNNQLDYGSKEDGVIGKVSSTVAVDIDAYEYFWVVLQRAVSEAELQACSVAALNSVIPAGTRFEHAALLFARRFLACLKDNVHLQRLFAACFTVSKTNADKTMGADSYDEISTVTVNEFGKLTIK